MRSAFILRLAGLLVLVTGIVSTGCGLQDYEKKLEEQQKKLAYFEAENANLEPKLVKPYQKPEKPKEKEKDDEPETFHPDNFFFRCPKGLATTPDDKPLGNFGHYVSRGDGTGFKEMYIAVQKGSHRDKFKTEVLKDLKMSGNPREVKVSRLGGRDVPFEVYGEEGLKPGTRLYILKNDPFFQVAIAFHFSPAAATMTNLEGMLSYSLASLKVGNSAIFESRSYRVPTAATTTPAKK